MKHPGLSIRTFRLEGSLNINCIYLFCDLKQVIYISDYLLVKLGQYYLPYKTIMRLNKIMPSRASGI